MGAINRTLQYVNMFGITIIITLVIMAAIFYYLLKVKKVSAKEEKVDNTSFRRKDASSYVPIKDVIYDGYEGLDSPGMIALSDTEFVAGVSVSGFDYGSASNNERIDAQVNAVAFFNLLESPVSFRQSVKSVDLSSNIAEYEEICKNVSYDLIELDEEYQTASTKLDDYLDDEEMREIYYNKLEKLRRAIVSKRHIYAECQNLISYMQSMSGDVNGKKDAIGVTTSQIMFNYTYNPSDHSTDLSKEEIYEEALRELKAKSMSYAEALSRCHFKAKRLSARELIGMIRKQTCPISGEDFELSELLDSSYTSLFISSDSLVEACKEKIGEDIYNERVAEYEKQLKDRMKNQSLELEREASFIKEDAMRQAMNEMMGGVE